VEGGMKVGLASDHAGFELARDVAQAMREDGHELVDFGPFTYEPGDDYPDYVIPLARSVRDGQVERGIAICGSGIGASVAANKIKGIRAGLCGDHYSSHQGVEHDDMNVLCLGARVTGIASALEMVTAFLAARFTGEERHVRRLAKVKAVEE
jgi:ribose 5-phosphate isomerase B